MELSLKRAPRKKRIFTDSLREKTTPQNNAKTKPKQHQNATNSQKNPEAKVRSRKLSVKRAPRKKRIFHTAFGRQQPSNNEKKLAKTTSKSNEENLGSPDRLEISHPNSRQSRSSGVLLLFTWLPSPRPDSPTVTLSRLSLPLSGKIQHGLTTPSY